MRLLSLFALAAPLVSAIQFREPVTNSTLKKGETYSVKWDSVGTDPSKFSIYLVNFVDWPPFYTQIASDVQTSAGQHDVTVPCAISSSWGFQLNAINGTNVYIIYAQTPRFSVGDGTCSGSDPIPSPNPTCEPVVTVTETVTSTIMVSPTPGSDTTLIEAPTTVIVDQDSDSDSNSDTDSDSDEENGENQEDNEDDQDEKDEEDSNTTPTPSSIPA